MSNLDHRLLDAGAFDAVFKCNQFRVSSEAFLLLASHNQLDCSRLGMVIGKKNVKLATRRNRVKRALREAFRRKIQPESVHIDLVVVARSGIKTEDKSLMNKQIDTLLERLTTKLRNA